MCSPIFKNSPEFATLSPAQQTKLNHDLRDFVLSGAELPPEQQAKLAQLQTEGAQLSAKFSQNVLDATDAFALYFDDAAPLAGIPEDSLAMFAAAAQSEGKTGYKIGLQIPHPRRTQRHRPLPRRRIAIAGDAHRLYRQTDFAGSRKLLTRRNSTILCCCKDKRSSENGIGV